MREMTAGFDLIWRKSLGWIFFSTTVIGYGSVFYLMLNRGQFNEFTPYTFFNFAIGFFLIVFVAKLVFGTFHLLNDLLNGARFLIAKWSTTNSDISVQPHERMTRWQFFNQLGLGATVLMVGSMVYGVTKGKFGYRIEKETILFPDLPEAFDGVRIVHISDMHLGSFDENFEAVAPAFKMINELEPDFIFFTGDLVNNFSHEAEAWKPYLSGLRAKSGKFSILGNHDYGDYAMADQPEKKAKSFNRVCEIHGEAGFRLLRNENVRLERNGESIALMGTENWGIGFHQYGDLAKTKDGVDPASFKIMLSHDPTFWQEHLLGKEPVHLTLSGHTHGAQFGLELPQFGIKFSPVSLRYKRWGGLYTEGSQHLYINRGFGYLAFPGRVGMPPEITLIELKKG
jgi:predicted MPP superfamily phosphohydrolase